MVFGKNDVTRDARAYFNQLESILKELLINQVIGRMGIVKDFISSQNGS